MAENGRKKSGDKGQYHGHILVRVGAGVWLLLSPIITPVQPAQLLRGLRTVKPLASLHLTLTPAESAFLYGLWKIPRSSHACL